MGSNNKRSVKLDGGLLVPIGSIGNKKYYQVNANNPNKTDSVIIGNKLAVDNGEVVEVNNNTVRVISADLGTTNLMANLMKNNPINKAFNMAFKTQEKFKDKIGLNDDGTMKANKGGNIRLNLLTRRGIGLGSSSFINLVNKTASNHITDFTKSPFIPIKAQTGTKINNDEIIKNAVKESYKQNTRKDYRRLDDGIKGWIPIVGDMLSAVEAGRQVMDGNYGNAALTAGLLAVPNFLEKPIKYTKNFSKKIINSAKNRINNIKTYKDIVSKPEYYIDGLKYAKDKYTKRADIINRNLLLSNDVPLNEVASPSNRILEYPEDALKKEPKIKVRGVIGSNLPWHIKKNGEYGDDIINIYPLRFRSLLNASKDPLKTAKYLKGTSAHEGTHWALEKLKANNLSVPDNNYYVASKEHPLYNEVTWHFGENRPDITKWKKSPEEYVAEMTQLEFNTKTPTNKLYVQRNIKKQNQMDNYLSKRFGFDTEENKGLAPFITKSLSDFGYANGGKTKFTTKNNKNMLGKVKNDLFNASKGNLVRAALGTKVPIEDTNLDISSTILKKMQDELNKGNKAYSLNNSNLAGTHNYSQPNNRSKLNLFNGARFRNFFNGVGNWFTKPQNQLIVGSIADAGLATAEGISSINAINKLQAPQMPSFLSIPSLLTTYNINGSKSALSNEYGIGKNIIDLNTASSAVKQARIRNLANKVRETRLQLEEQKNNQETNLINQNKVLQAQIAIRNNDSYNQYLNNKTAFENQKLLERAQAVSGTLNSIGNIVGGLIGGLNSLGTTNAMYPNGVTPLNLTNAYNKVNNGINPIQSYMNGSKLFGFRCGGKKKTK